MLRLSLSKSRATCLVAILAIGISVPAAANLVVSGCGIARIDGVISPGEWTNAAKIPVNINTASGTTPGTLYVMNDNLNLYLALRFQATALDEQDGLSFDFDNNNNGVWPEEGDDVLVTSTQLGGFYDGYRNSDPPNCTAGGVPDCVSRDASVGGVSNGQGALANDGTYTTIEMSHELNSGDTGHDFALGPGSVVGFHMAMFITQGGVLYDTHLPNAPFGFDQIQIASCRPPALSGCGAATIDGVVNAAEWASAGTWDLTVRTPHGGTAPARLYVMNDAFNLYLGFRFERSAADDGNTLDFEFDNNNNGIAENGDDVILVNPDIPGLVDDVRTNAPPCPAGSAAATCGFRDTDLGGTNDGAGAFSNNGVYSMYEMSHPLNSGDVNDFALSAFGGTTVGYWLFLRTITVPSAYPADFGDTFMPGVRDYAQITMCEPAPAAGVAQIVAFISNLKLPPRQADALRKSLDSAQKNINAGKTKQAANDLDKFTKDVRKLVSNGELASGAAAQMISVANNIMQKL